MIKASGIFYIKENTKSWSLIDQHIRIEINPTIPKYSSTSDQKPFSNRCEFTVYDSDKPIRYSTETPNLSAIFLRVVSWGLFSPALNFLWSSNTVWSSEWQKGIQSRMGYSSITFEDDLIVPNLICSWSRTMKPYFLCSVFLNHLRFFERLYYFCSPPGRNDCFVLDNR